MESLAARWSKAPRWVHGLVLANLYYLVIAGIAVTLQTGDNSALFQLGWVFFPLLWSFMASPLQPIAGIYYSVWCALGALLVQRFGERKGSLILFASMYILGIGVLLYIFSHLSLTIL